VNSVFPVIAVLALVVPAVAGAQTSTSPTSETPVVVTSGEGIVKRAPDQAFVMVAAESRAKTAKEAQQANAVTMTAVLDKLKTMGLGGDAVQTRAYDVQPEFDYANNRRTLRGYVARNSVEVRVDALPKLGEVIEVAVNAGANSIGSVRFDLKDRAGAERQALQMAVAEARERANALATAAGVRVERIVRIAESIRQVPIPFQAEARTMAAEGLAAAPPVQPGEIEIRATVTLTAAIR
jgi:uncharacterized protein YggE